MTGVWVSQWVCDLLEFNFDLNLYVWLLSCIIAAQATSEKCQSYWSKCSPCSLTSQTTPTLSGCSREVSSQEAGRGETLSKRESTQVVSKLQAKKSKFSLHGYNTLLKLGLRICPYENPRQHPVCYVAFSHLNNLQVWLGSLLQPFNCNFQLFHFPVAHVTEGWTYSDQKSIYPSLGQCILAY